MAFIEAVFAFLMLEKANWDAGHFLERGEGRKEAIVMLQQLYAGLINWRLTVAESVDADGAFSLTLNR